MSYTNVYPTRINWENEPSIASPINATNLNKIDYAVYEHDRTLETWDVTKANQSDLLLSVKSIDYDDETGVFIFTWQNGTTKTVDLNIEKIPVSFSMSPLGVITMTAEDGTTYTADVGALIKTYTFTDSARISFTVTTDLSGNKTVTADIVDGSITGAKLQPDYLADCQSAATSASNSATTAGNKAQDSEAWAVGERGGVPVPSTDPAYENNAKWYAEHGTGSSLAGLSDTDITSPTNGQVLTYDGSKWINDDPSAGGGSKVVVSTAEASLIGTVCTLAQGGDSYSATFDSLGVAIFEGVTLTGTVTITATDGQSTATRTLEIPYFGNYTQTISFFSATITATFPADKGATCTCDGVTASTSPYTFTVGAAGTYSVVCTLDGVNKSVSVPITTDGQSESVNFTFGTINLTYDNAFRGLTITCVNGGTTISKTAPISGNSMSFYPPSTGTWTISGVYSGYTYTTSATVTALGTAVSCQLQTIPDGKTVTPVNNIQKWLNCGGIFDKVTYTTLADVLADSTTLLALMSDNNAVDYLVRSTTWASGVTANSTAMTDIGANNYCANTLLDDATWCDAICNSTYFESVLNVKVPTMTSNTTPSGECITSNEQPAYRAYNAFDSSVYSTIWATVNGHTTNEYVGYDFGSAVKVSRVGIINSCYNSAYYNQGVQDFEIKGSDDNSTWHSVYTGKATQATSTSQTFEYFDFNSDDAYRYWIILCKNNYGASDAIVINQLQFYGRKDI